MKEIKGSYKLILLLLMALLILPGSCKQQGRGCTDALASNPDPSATENDGTCSYDPVWAGSDKTVLLSEEISGTSGLIYWDGLLWTHNDHQDLRLYGIDTATAEIIREYLLPEVSNSDWEDIAEDGEYIYLGDFGNNASGNRTDLNILRIEMISLKLGHPSIDTIWFSYSDQLDLSPAEANKTEFDCEALVVGSEQIYLFTKQWLSGQTTLYALSKQPGRHVAQRKANLDVQGLVTGATLIESDRVLALSGYTGILQPFIYLLYDYPGQDFFSGNKRRVNLLIPFLQVEGITSVDGLTYFLSNESFVLQTASNIPQQLHRFDLRELLGDYLKSSGI